MPGSYKNINYSIRPAKSVERKMFCEAFNKLSKFDDIKNYRYIGMGSPFFTDFSLVHKSLRICDMVSIEENEEDTKRFYFNRPFGCIKIKFGKSSDVIQKMPWKKKTILWLDYDEKLSEYMLSDIYFFVSRAVSGSIIIVTVNAECDNLPPEKIQETIDKGMDLTDSLIEFRYNELKGRIGEGKIPLEVFGENLSENELIKIYWKIINNEIKQAIQVRNGGEHLVFKYTQLFNFVYKDSHKMLSIGGIIYTKVDEKKFKDCKFKDLDFIRFYDKEYNIEIPNLTFDEIRKLNKTLPPKNKNKLKKIKGIVTGENYKKYSKIYRYFPNFIEAEI